MADSPLPTTALGDEHIVQLFPSVGIADPHLDSWRVLVHGDVYSPGRLGLTKRFFLRVLQRLMRAQESQIQGPLFQGRIRRFLDDPARGRRMVVRLGSHVAPVPGRTGPTGHFSGVVRVPTSAARALVQTAGKSQMLSVQLFEGEHRAGRAEGKIHLLPREGLSVISDIDDTIKESHVGCRRSLLQNTFLREFATVAGMAEVYRQWAAEGAAFHYVSSSPWQLYGHLADWREQAQFPDGSFHLRCFRLRDHLFRRLLILRRSGKAAVLANLLRLAPQRRFVLVGDSGEHDPEIYGALARRFPRQVERILIRSLPSGKSLDRRIAKAFRQISPSKWQVYETSDDLPQSLLDAAVTR